ncbi:hypothetical protein [Ornithinimicrobium pratense]|uniref:Dihydroorotate dehydrogenase electron transfer subunit iron-sulphur cluster binding domain-containing protein n=1 Tax=Ornithinimicrobium pratense TaxID=2593973 RepID=A0A5J6V639_9MICO|nr:hypothetical protein [Ornithinimicrobium pratense]QFG68784.1 hypothetical protein FY030_08745 [Ornithinimicrobium pratense]
MAAQADRRGVPHRSRRGAARETWTSETGTTAGPELSALVSAARPEGGYDVLTLSVPARPSWAGARPGQLLVLPADPARGAVLPRVLWLAGVQGDPLHGTTIQVILSEEEARGWPVGSTVRLLGPLGRGFALPAQPVDVVIVSHEESAAPVSWLVALLRERGCLVHVLLPADDADRRLDPGPLRRHATGVVLTSTEDLPAALGSLLGTVDPALVLALGPTHVVRTVAEQSRGRVVRVAAVDPGAPVVCGTGVCGVCDLEVADDPGSRRVRPCVEGPVVPGEWLLTPRTGVPGAS